MWARCDAEASPDRGFYYHPSRHSADQPIVAGWAYQFIAQLGFERESWVAPVDAARVRPTENANAVAVEQVKALLARTSERGGDSLFVFDAGYDPVRLQRGLEGCGAQILVRLRAGRCFYADPEGPPARTGRPRRHGRKMDTKDPNMWLEPSTEHRSEDSAYGSVRVRSSWAGLHPKTQQHPTRGTRRPRPIVQGMLVLVEVSRLPRLTRQPRTLWLWWSGSGKARISICSGAPTSAGSTWSTPSASSSRSSVGPRLGCATSSRPTCGRGWCSPRSRNCAWDARTWRIGGCPGSVTTLPAA